MRDRFAICGEDALAASEGRDQHQERRSRQVEVRHQALDDTKLMPRMNEETRAPVRREDQTARINWQRFERTGGRRADSNDSPPVAEGFRQRIRRGFRHRVCLWIDFVFVDVLDPDWLEGPVPDMQR